MRVVMESGSALKKQVCREEKRAPTNKHPTTTHLTQQPDNKHTNTPENSHISPHQQRAMLCLQLVISLLKVHQVSSSALPLRLSSSSGRLRLPALLE